ncbi:uncharacterized protein [Palaemon carinicauda]|uniref:uncharacterized protein isoform X4 n=1 Tax=Palaemon carinicauda TaxID=392227 RepID=UPI0035B645AD
MGSSEWEGLLERRLAILPGSRDPGGGPILVIPLPQDPSCHDVGSISATVKYLKTIPSVSSRERGWVVVVDARVCHYRLVKPTVSTIRATLGYIRHLFVVRPEGFWDKQRVDCRKSEVDNQPIYVSVSKLTKYMELSQLPIELGGTLEYDHQAWLKTRKAYEEFVDECERARRDLESLQAELRREEPCSRASTLHDLLSVNTNTYNTITARPALIFNMGQEVLKVLEMDEESGFRVCEGQGDAAEAASRVRAMLHDLHLLTTAVEACWRRLNTALDTYMQVRDLESEMNDIGKWLVSAGQTLLAETSIGTTTDQAEALLREHEAIELKCRETYGRWAGLRYRVEDALDRGDGDLRALADHRTTTTDLRSLKDYTDTLVRTFASRLDRRRTLILASVRFHRIAHQMGERCSVLLQQNRWLPQTDDVDTLKKTLRELTARKEAIDYLASEGTRAGEKLLDLLTVGVKDLSGRDVSPDYTNELNHVHALLTSLHEHYVRAARQADLHKLRLQQNIQLLTCHRDVKQAHKWLKALLEALVKAHSHVGRSSEEIRRLKSEHQHFQETAAGTFEYGYESARAALLVEKSAGGTVLSESRRMVSDLEFVWKMFIQGSQEQLTRLRVAGVFFRTMEQHLERLDNLCAGLVEKMSGRQVAQNGEMRSLLTSRDRLLREIGRNVRLGKLLKERLLDPLVPNYSVKDHNENLLAQESITERIQHITNRAQQLDDLMFSSAAPPTAPSTATTTTTTTTSLPEGHYGRVEGDQESGSEYWTCSECTCTSSGTFYTCPECRSLQDLFVFDDTRPPSEEELPLDEILRRRSRSRSKSKGRDGVSKSRRSRSRSRSSSKGPDEKESRSKTKTSTLPKRRRDAPQDHPDAIERARSRSRSRSKSLTREIVASFKEFRDKVTRGRSRSKSGERKAVEEEPEKEKHTEKLEKKAEKTTPSDRHSPTPPPPPPPSSEGTGRPVNLGNGDVQIPIHIHVDARDGSIATPEKQEKEKWKEVSSEKVTTRLVFHGGDGQGDRTLTLEQITSLRAPEKSTSTDIAKDTVRWKVPPRSSAADSAVPQTSPSVQSQNLGTASPVSPTASTDSSNLAQKVITKAPLNVSIERVPSLERLVLGSPTSILAAAASPAAVDLLLESVKRGPLEALSSVLSPIAADPSTLAPVSETSKSPSVARKLECNILGGQRNLLESSAINQESIPLKDPARLSHPIQQFNLADSYQNENLAKIAAVPEVNLSVKLSKPSQLEDTSQGDEKWPLPPSEPDIPGLFEQRHSNTQDLQKHSSSLEDLPLPPPPRPPTPTLIDMPDIPPPRPPEPVEALSDIQNNNYLAVQDPTLPRPFQPLVHEIAPPRPSLPAMSEVYDDIYEHAPPPRPDPPSDDADDEREPTPPRPEPPLEYEYPFLPRPLLPTIHETSPAPREGFPPVREVKTEIYMKKPPYPRQKRSIIKSFTPPRPTEADMTDLPTPTMPCPQEFTEVEEEPEMSAPAEPVPVPSSPSEPPCTSTSPEKSGTQESDDGAADVPPSPPPVTEPMASEPVVAEPPEPEVQEPVAPEEPEESVPEPTSPRPSGLPPRIPPQQRPEEDELIKRMKKPWSRAFGGVDEAPEVEPTQLLLQDQLHQQPLDDTMSDSGGVVGGGGGSATSPTPPGMSDSEGGVVGRTTSASGMSRTSGTSRTSLTTSAPTTTISTIAVQSGNTRIVIALLQSAEWLELRVVELTPGMVYLVPPWRRALQLQRAHEEVLTKLQSKQSPVEDLLNQADQLISTQRPRAEVYAAMAESLGLAWKDLNSQLETRKEILDMGVAFHSKARQYSDCMDAAERAYTDNVMPNDAEGARQFLSALHDHKRAILEASMYTLQEAQALLARLRGLAAEGATLDSRPLQIKTNIEFSCSQIEHYLESLHDRRRFLDGLFSARKHHLEQCLALCLLYQDLTEAVTALKQLRDEVSDQQGLGESQGNTEILLHEHMKKQATAKEIQDKCVMHLKKAEKMASSGHYAGLEARSRAYSVLEAATALHETCDTRKALLNQSILFFKLAQTALTKLDQAEVQVAGLSGEGAQRLSMVIGVVEEAIQPALAEGYAILEVTGGKNQPHNMGISLMVEELERRRSHLSSVCVTSTEQVLQRTELSNAFLERYNTIDSWLVRIGDAFLQGHQDPGGSLSLARDFLHLHQTLNHDVMEKKAEIDSLAAFLESLVPELSPDDANSFRDKIQQLLDHWTALKKLLDIRIAIAEKYVKFHEDAERVNNEHEAFEILLKDAKGEDHRDEVEAKWEQLQKLYLDLCTSGKSFCQDVKDAEDPYLDANRAILCVENILEQLGKRRLVITDLHSHFHMKITTTKEMITLWNTYRENVNKMQLEMSKLENDFCPLLRGDPADPEAMASDLEGRLAAYVSTVKKAQEDIQNMMTRAEVMSYKGDQESARDEVISALLQLYQNLQNKATEYQILGYMLVQWCRNIAEIHRSCDKIESQFGAMSFDIGGVEGQIREHEASKQAVLELLKFAQNEAASIVNKIREQCPAEAGAQDIALIEEMLQRRGRTFETVWMEHQQLLERQLKRSQYHVDLQVISDQLRDLSEQLARMRGHYGDSLAAATNMQSAFKQFQVTVEMLERRIMTFVSTTVKMLGPEDVSGEVQDELAELEKKWSTFQMQVGQSQKSIELSIDFFKLVEEAEDWFKQASKLLVEVAGDSANIQSPEQAENMRSRIEIFLEPGREDQERRITRMTSLGSQLYGDAVPKQIEVVSHQHTHMIESLTIITRNLTMMVQNLRTTEEHRQRQNKEKEELAASLAAAQAEAEVARLAAAAAEEAKKAAEEVARTMAIPVEPIVPERVEIEIQTEAIPLPDEEPPPKQDDVPPLKKPKLIDEEPQPMAPVFMTPLVGATVTEGVKFSFECRVIGFPMPEVEWLKDNMSITANPDYKTTFDEGVCTLTIEETFTEDSALFTCKAVNCAGMAETSATLIVKEAEIVEVMAPPNFTKKLSDCTAQEGSSYQLEATVEGNPLPVVSWAKDGTCVDESPDYVITYNNGDCILRFEEVFLEDQAEYSCKATNDLGEDHTKAKLSVAAVELSERPKFTMTLSNVMARAGQKFKLECHVTGTPTPTVAWFHNSKPVKETPDCKISFDGQIVTLVMSEAFPKNAGVYTVVAKNSAGEAQCSANVSVKGRIPTETSDSEVTSDVDVEPVKPTIQLALKDTSVKEGKSARLDCVIVGQPEPEVIWYHDDTPVKESNDFKLLFHGDRCSLIIQEAFLEDSGIYRVVAMNSAGEASTACFLNVEPEPEMTPPPPSAPAIAPRFSELMTDSHVTEGQAVILKATVTGEPKPTIAWFREGLPLIPDNELQIHEDADGHVTAEILSATLDHTGQYEIVASNSAGTAKCVAYLSIEPRLPTPSPVTTGPQEPPVFTRTILDASVPAGSGVKFEAEVTGQPMPTVHWTLNDSPITGQEFFRGQLQYVLGSRGGSHTLQLPTTTRLQGGRIAIVAENSIGKAVSAANLTILEPASVAAKRALPEQPQQQTDQQQIQPPGMFRKESHVTTTSSSSSSFMQQSTIMETSHVTKIVTSDGVADEKRHSMSASSSSQVKKATGQPTVEVHGSHLQEIKQDGGAPAMISDKVSFVKKEGEKITQQVAQDTSTSYATVMPQAKKIVAGKKKLSPARFIVPLQGVIANDGDRVVLECTIDGHPDPTVSWSHNGGPVSETAETKSKLNKATLILENVNQSHSGHYTCVIKNDAGMAQCTCDVIIKKTQFPPVISKRLQPAVVSVGERLHLEIDVTGTPSPNVTWTRDGMPITPSEHFAIRSEGTRHILVIQQAVADDSGRYSAIASNSAGRAESLADVRVMQVVKEPPPTSTHTIIFTDTVDESKSISETIEEGHAKTVKRAIEEVTVEAPTIPSPTKMHKPTPKPVPIPLPTPPNYQVSSPEPGSEIEEEVKRPPGRLKAAWPPLPSEDEEMVKIEPMVEITSKNVSSIIASFSSTVDEVPLDVQSRHVPKIPAQPKPKSFPQPMQQVESVIQLQPEPEPEYGYISPTELEQGPQKALPLEIHAQSPEFVLAPEHPVEIVSERESSPEYVLAPEAVMEVDVQQKSDFVNLVKHEYRKAATSVIESSTVLSPIPEVVSEPAQTPVPEPEALKVPSPEPISDTPVPEQETMNVLSPEPVIDTSVLEPEALKVPSPEPVSDTPVLEAEPMKIPYPESVWETPIPGTEAIIELPQNIQTPEPVKHATPEPPRTPTPEPVIPLVHDAQIVASEEISEVTISEPQPPLKIDVTEESGAPPESHEVSITENYEEYSPVLQAEHGEYKPNVKREVTTENVLKESTFVESKKSFSKSSFTTVETNVYTSGISSPPLQESANDSTTIVEETAVQQPAYELVQPEIEPIKPITEVLEADVKEMQIPVAPEHVFEPVTGVPYSSETYFYEDQAPLVKPPEDQKFSPEPVATEIVDYPPVFGTEIQDVIKSVDLDFVPDPVPQPEPSVYPDALIEVTDKPKDSAEEQPQHYASYGGTIDKMQQASFASSASSTQMSSFSSMSSQMQTMFVTSSDVKTKVFTDLYPQQPIPEPTSTQVVPETAPQSQPYSIPLKSERQPLEPLIIPPPKPVERASTEEPIRPPKHPDRDETREQKKPKKKRESVIQLAKRLEETIIPMSPDEVPGGIRMFPSPKQPSTPVRETPTPTRESASGQVTSASEDEGPSGFKTERFPDLEPFPFVVEQKPRRERPRSMPPPAPKKFVPGSYTDSEYESDMELDQRLNLKKLKFEAPVEYTPEPLLKELTKPLVVKPLPAKVAPEPQPPKPRPLSLGQEPLLPFAVIQPPVFDGSMRPDVLKKDEEEVKEAPKSVTPKKKSKLVEKFLESSGITEEEKVVRVSVKKTKKEVIPPPQPIPLRASSVSSTVTDHVVSILEKPVSQPPPAPQPKPDTPKIQMDRPKSEPPKPKTEKPVVVEIKTERPPPKPMVDIDTRQGIKPSKIAKLLPSPDSETGPSVKRTSKTSYTESKTQMSSVSYQKMESTLTSTQFHTSQESTVIPKPDPVPIFSQIPQVPVYPESSPQVLYEKGPEQPQVSVPSYIQEPEPTPVHILEPIPMSVPEPEPIPVYIPETTPLSTLKPEPEPVFILEPEPEPVFILEPEPEPTIIYSPEPEQQPAIIYSPEPIHIPEPEPIPVCTPEVEPIPVCSPEFQFAPQPELEPSLVIAPEPEPVYSSEPEPELAPVQIPEPEPEPVYLLAPEPVVIEKEPEPSLSMPEPVVIEKEPEPSLSMPEPVISPPITLDPIPRHAPSPSPAPGFRSVRAPTPKRGQTPAKTTTAPPPPFDMVPIKLEPLVTPAVVSMPKPEPKPEPKLVVDTPPEVKPTVEPIKKEEKKPSKVGFNPVKIPAGGKMLPVWPPQMQEEPPKITLKARAHSLERPPVTEAPQIPARPHEAPPSIYWSSNVTIQEKRKTWPQQIPQAQTITSASRYETTSKSSMEETKISKFSSQSSVKSEMKIETSVPRPTLAPTKPSPQLHSPVVPPVLAKQVASPVASPGLMKQDPSPVVSPALSATRVLSPPISRQVAPDVSTSVVSPPLKLPDPPDLSIVSMFDLKPKPKENIAVYHPIHKVPKIEPKKGKGKDTSSTASVPLKEGTVISTIIPLPPLEPFPFSVDTDKGKRPRGRAPSMPRRFIPSSFTESEYESDLDAAPSPVSRLYMSDSEAVGFKPLNIRLKRGRSMQPRVPSPPAPSTLAPPEPFDETLSYANAVFPELETGKQAKMSQSKHIIQTVTSLARQITPESKLGAQRVTAKPLTPQAPIVPPPAIPKVAPVTLQMPIPAPVPVVNYIPSSNVAQNSFIQTEDSSSSSIHIMQTVAQTEKGVKNIMKKFEGSGPAPLPQKVFVPNQPPAATTHSPAVSSATVSAKLEQGTQATDGMDDSTNAGSLKKKPASPKSRKKTESVQMTALEQEESGYVADTEGTLPRKHAKTTQSSASSSSFSKSESFMSASFSKSESRSFSSTEFGQIPTSAFPSGGGLALNGNFPSTSFSIPTASASSVGQTSHFSSSCKSTESKSSQMFTSRSEEIREEKRSEHGPKAPKASPPPENKRPKFEEFKRDTHGQPGSHGPFSEDTYYAMRDESDISTGGTRTQKKVEVKSETHVQVMSDKKVEVFETTSFDVSPKAPKQKTFDSEKKIGKAAVKETKEAKFKSTDVKTTSSAPKLEKLEPIPLPYKTESEVKIAVESVVEQKSSLEKPKPVSEVRMPDIEPLKSTGLVKMAVSKQEVEKEELDLKPFPFKPEPEKPKKPRGGPPPHPSKFVKGEFRESDYDSDYEGRIPAKWKPADSDTEDQAYSKVELSVKTQSEPQPKERTPTPPTVFDKPPVFEGPPRPKVDFPESETEPEREISPEIVLPEKIEIVTPAEVPKITPKKPKIFKSQPKPKPPPRSPSPVLQPGTPPEEAYIEPPTQSTPFSNAIGVESTKITKIADSSQYHKRFVSMQQTTRVIKFTDNRTTTRTSESQQQPAPKSKPKSQPAFERKEQTPIENLEPFPFTPEPVKSKKDRGQPPPQPAKFQKGDFTESDYETEFEDRIKPKWQPPDSDAEEPSYNKVKPKLRSDRTPSKTRERTPTPPTVFDVPPETDGPWRPVIESTEVLMPEQPPLEIIIPKVETTKKTIIEKQKVVVPQPEKAESPPLPPPGSPPIEGVIVQETQYVVDKVDVKSKFKPPKMVEVQSFEEKPFTKVTERTEKTFTKLKMEEELHMKKEKMEIIKTTVTEFEDAPERPPPPVEPELKVMEVEKFPDLEPFPFEPDKPKPRRDRGPLPPKPKKFIKGEFRESDYDSDYEGRVKPKWKPADSDMEDPEYTPVRPPPPTTKQVSLERDRTPTPPTKFDTPPTSGGPLRPTIDYIQQPVMVPREASPEIIIPKVTPIVSKSTKIKPKAPAIRPKEPEPEKPREPTPPLPEPGPQPEIGFIPVKHLVQEEEEDAHIRMIKKKIESKKAFEIDIDITDIYDFVSESDHDKTDTESSSKKPFPKLEPFPYEPEPAKPKRQRGPPPPHPKKFLKGEFRGSDYESDYEAPIAPKWLPPDSEGEEYAYRKVAPPAGEIGRQRSESTGRDPSPPSKFDHPPHFEGPPRPVMELSDLPRRERRESLEEYSIPRFPKVEFKPFDLEDDVVGGRTRGGITTDTETEPETHAKISSPTKGGIDKKYAKTAQKVVSHQFDDMTQTFRHKAQKFAEQLVTEVFAAREGSVPAEPAGEPPSLPEELKRCSVSPDSTAAPPAATVAEELKSPTLQEPQAYRDESRVSEFGTKHIDPDTGLIYFKYDFGYEFGVILPGEAKKVEKKKTVNGDVNGDIPIPVIHEKTDTPQTKSSTKTNGHIHPSDSGVTQKPSSSDVTKQKPSSKSLLSSQDPDPEQITSPQPSLQSDISETDLLGSPPLSATPPSTPSTPRSGPLTQPTRPPLYITNQTGYCPYRSKAVLPLRDLTVVAGEAVKLECVVQADPPVQVTWSKGDIILQNSPHYQIVYRNGVCRLIIPQVFPEDDGVYTCTAVNLLGMATTDAAICVTGEKE